MGRKTLNNVYSLIDLTEKAPSMVMQAFSGLAECAALAVGMDWGQTGDAVRSALLERIKRLKKDQREPAEREALRVLRLASTQGAEVLSVVAQQLNDIELETTFQRQEGAEIGRAVWMRTHSDDTLRLFDVAESILNAGDIRGVKKLYDAFEVPCDDAPPFVWSDVVREKLEAKLTTAMLLTEPCEIIHVQMSDAAGSAGEPVHYLVVRFAGDMSSIQQMRNRRRENFFYYPARDATIVYAPGRNLVEVCAQAHASRSILADILSQHGFNRPLSSRPLNRFRYDLSRFARRLVPEKPSIPGVRIERLYLTEMTSLLGNTTHSVTLRIDTTDDLQDVAVQHWSNHPFQRADAILGVTLVAELAFEGETAITPLVIKLSEPNRCSLQSERKNPRLRRCGEAILEALGVLKPLHPGDSAGDPQLILQVAALLEHAHGPMDGVALARLGVDIERFADEGLITEGDRIHEIVVDVADDEPFTVKLERSNDPGILQYRDPITGHDVRVPAAQARRWRIDSDWLRQELIEALGKSLHAPGGSFQEDEPIFLGELEVDGRRVALYFASRLSSDRHYAKVDGALRLTPRSLPGIVLTTTPDPLPFAGTNIVVPIETVVADGGSATAIDLDRLAVRYRHGRVAAMGGTSIGLNVSIDGYSATLSIPGKAPWQVTSKAKIAVLQRLVDAFHSGTPHVKTKVLMADTGCTSPANLFSKNSPWRDYLETVTGAHAWQLRVAIVEAIIEDEEDEFAEANA